MLYPRSLDELGEPVYDTRNGKDLFGFGSYCVCQAGSLAKREAEETMAALERQQCELIWPGGAGLRRA